MYAVFKNGGKQYKVIEGSIVLLDKMNLEPKSKVELNEILAIVDNGKKVVTFKKRRRKDSKTKRGFRRDFTRVRILKIIAK